MDKFMQSLAIKEALGTLKQLRHIMDTNDDVQLKLTQVLETIVKKVGADAATCYVVIDNNYLELFASYGFKQDAKHKVRLRSNEGITGEIASSKRSITMNNVWLYPKFVSKPELIEEKDFKSFIGVPIIRWNKSIGVLSLYNCNEVERSSAEIELLETIAMLLVDILTSEEMIEYKRSLIKSRGMTARDKIKGISLNKGYGLGSAVVHKRRQSVTNIFAEDKDIEIRKLEVAHIKMNEDLDEKFTSTKLGLGEHLDILDAYKMFAKDKGWYRKIVTNIEGGLTAEAAVERAYEDMWSRLSASSDKYLKERLHDLRDVADRLQAYLNGDYKNVQHSEAKDIIIVAQTMGPAELMDYDYSKIRALIIEEGTPTMHVSIVAKALNIPVVARIKGVISEIKNGQYIAVDGNEAIVYLAPSSQVVDNFKIKLLEKEEVAKKMASLRKMPAKTLDGVDVNMYINVGLQLDFDYIKITNCDGVGLYRTEIPFMASEEMPSVDKQVSYYADLMEKAGNKKVMFRSLDVGSDKLLPYWAYFGEDNPAIGWRSIRITLDRRAILRKQLKAFLIATAGKELNVMFPMISDLTEFEEAKETLMIELAKVKAKGAVLPKKINIGLMIEVPSVIFQLDDILKKVDFISIGTNDLAQFIFACDRGNSKLAERYDVLSPPFLKVMKTIIDKANKAGVYCSVCGEMASNPIEAMVLIGLGYRNLSVNGSIFGNVKSMIRSMNVEEVTDYVNMLVDSTQSSLRQQLTAYARDHAIEIY